MDQKKTFKAKKTAAKGPKFVSTATQPPLPKPIHVVNNEKDQPGGSKSVVNQTLLGSSEKSNQFAIDIYENEIPAVDYYSKNPLKIQFAIRWPHRVPRVMLNKVLPKFYMHGIFSDAKAIWHEKSHFKNTELIKEDQKIVGRLTEAEEKFKGYITEIAKYWPNLQKPTSFEAAEKFILREWKKHGYRTGMSATMYLYYGLAVRDAVPDNFGITIGVPISLKEVLDCAKKVMNKLTLFGKSIGKNIIPKILFGRKKILGAYTIDEIHLQFTRIVIDNESKAKLLATSSTKPFSGPAKDLSTLLILPSAEQMKQLAKDEAKQKQKQKKQLAKDEAKKKQKQVEASN